MPSNTTYPAVLHIRDFVDHAEPDPTRLGNNLAMQLQVSLHVPYKDICSDDVVQDEILTLIRFFNERNQPDLYQQNTFVYASGSFLTDCSGEEDLHILLHANTIDRHPGDHNDTESYFLHCPEAAQPTVTFLGIVVERGGQLNSGSTLLHYRLLSTVYNASTRAHHTFPISAYFKNGQRWVNFPQLNINTYIFVTGRVFGVTKENRQLAVIIDDIHFLPTPTLRQPMLNSPPSKTGKRKQLDRWSQRASPRTPTKAAHLMQSSPSPTEANPPTTFRLTYDPATSAVPDDTDKDTLITWSDTADDTNSSPPLPAPGPERRSKRPRKL